MFYGNAEDFKKYHTSRGKQIPEAWDTSLIESALLVASEWLDFQYETSWIGYKKGGYNQERSWPRESAIVQYYPFNTIPNDEIPIQVVNATYEAAFREAENKGCLTTDFKQNKYKSVSISGALSVEYRTGTAGDSQLEIPIVENLMSILLDDSSAGNFSNYSGKAVRV